MKQSGISISAITVSIGLALTLLALAFPYDAGKASRDPSASELAGSDKIAVELVILTALVNDHSGQPVTNLRYTDFTVLDQDSLQPIAYFSREDQPLSVAIVFDTSSSVEERSSSWFAAICQGILHFKQLSHEQNEYTLVGADLIPHVVTDWTRENEALIEGLSKMAPTTPKTKTVIYDACQLALKKLGERSTSKSAVLLISDGQDGGSTIGYSDLHDSMLRSAGLVYLIAPSYPTKPLAESGLGNLSRLSLESGATVFYPSSDGHVKAVFQAISSELRTRYVIGYYPPNRIRNGAWHPVRITARRESDRSTDNPELIVRTRSGYFSPTELR
jgi:Ca-activated chloride channel family protein